MANKATPNIDEEIISQVGLQLAKKSALNVSADPASRVFEYPLLDNVFVMESDLYGNIMPPGSCFLAFKGRNGWIGKHLKIDTLKYASVEDIKRLVDNNHEG
jgi:hypothetical protein